jgi:hypothetical protein
MGICSAVDEWWLMFFLTKRYAENGQERGSAVLLDRSPAITFPLGVQKLWAMVDQPRQVSVEAAGLSELICTPYQPDFRGELIKAAENRLEVMFDLEYCEERMPMFLSESREHRPCQYDVVLELEVSDIWSLADVQAYLAFARAFEEGSPFELPQPLRHKHSTELAENAHRICIANDLYLPCEIENGSTTTPGCVYFGQSEPSVTGGATLFLSDPVPIHKGTVLRRTVHWAERRGKEKMSYHSRLGTIQ